MNDKPTLTFRLPAGFRQYGDSLFIAQTLGFPMVSAAAPTRDEAAARLAGNTARLLGQLHPRLLADAARPATLSTRRVSLPVADTLAPHEPVDVLVRRLGDRLVYAHLPLHGVGTWHRGDEPDDVLLADDASLTHALAELLTARGASDSRPIPDAFWVEPIDVRFEPLDLVQIPPEHRWRDYFDRDELPEPDGAARPLTPVLDGLAQRWAAPWLDAAATSDATSHAPHDTNDADALAVRRFGPVFGRDEVLGELASLLDNKIPAAVVLVGAPRVGKTSLVQAYARELQARPAETRALWFADPPRLCAGDPMSPGWQQQAHEVARELEATGDVLYLGRLVEALDAGKYIGSDYNLAQFFKPMLADRRLRIVAEATIDEWNQIERRDVGFARAFTVIRVEEPGPEATGQIVARAADELARREAVALDPQAVARAVALQRRFATEGSTLGRTIDFLRRTVVQARQRGLSHVGMTELVESFCRDTGMPSVLLLDEHTLDLEAVRARLSRRVMGQRDAVLRVADIVGVAKAGLAADDRPLGSFLFVGMTGVGKTELARALAEFLFGDERRLVRLDMSEFATADAYNRLIGEGGDDGDLTGPVRRQPFSVLLLDEIEKAHATVFDLLLQVLGEARLTDVQGRTTRFQNTIIIMTSNLGVETLRPSMGFSDGQGPADNQLAHFRREAERFFRPEFLARIDQFIAFEPLDRQTVAAIARRELDGLRSRDGLSNRDVAFHYTERLVEWVVQRGWQPRYGARPIKRVVETEIVWPLAAELARQLGPHPGAAGARRPLGGYEVFVDVAPRSKESATDERLEWRIVPVHESRLSGSRALVLEQLDRVGELRRKLLQGIYSDTFCDLEWHISQYDVGSQSPEFWKAPTAAALAQAAERARQIVEPFNALHDELASLEDLATEAYHSRTFDIVPDIDERIAELDARLEGLGAELVRASVPEPDHAVIFLSARHPQDTWRGQLVEWYRQLCAKMGWQLTIHEPRPDAPARRPAPGDDRYRNDASFNDAHPNDAYPGDSHLGDSHLGDSYLGDAYLDEPARDLARYWRPVLAPRAVTGGNDDHDGHDDRRFHDDRHSHDRPYEDVRPGPLALEIHGRGAAPLLHFEEGLHRFVGPDGHGLVDVVIPGYRESFLHPDELRTPRGTVPTTRTWNVRNRELSLGEEGSVAFDPRDPWAVLVPLLEEQAWNALAYFDY